MGPIAKLSNRYRIMVSDVDFTKKLKLSAAFNYFQEIAGLHAENLGIGFNTIEQEYGSVWVLTRMRVDITKYPVWDEEVIIETWPLTPGKYEFERDYLVKDSEGEIIARAASLWVILDVKTRKLKRATDIAAYFPETIGERAINCPLGKIKPIGEPEVVYKRVIGCSDIDINGHLNNSKYIDFIMDCFTMEQLKKYQANSIQVNYLNEAFPGDTIALYKYAGASETNRVYVEGINEKNGSTVFIARLDITPCNPSPPTLNK